MKRSVPLSLLAVAALFGAALKSPQVAASSSSTQLVSGVVTGSPISMPVFATILNVDRTDDTTGATACTDDPDDCSLRGAIIAANADLSADPVIINLQPGTTYEIGLNDGTQENNALSGDLDIKTSLHTVTIVGGGSSGPNATIIDGAGLNTNFHDRVFHVTNSGVTVVFQDLVIQNGQAVDDGTAGVSLNPRNQTTHRVGGGILNNGGSVTLNNVVIQSCQALGRADSTANPDGILEARGGGLGSLGTTGNVVVMNSVLSGNTAIGGNGARNTNNNVASNAKGGSIYFEGGTLNINGSRIESSAANGGTGGNNDQNGGDNGGVGGLAQGGGVWVGGGTVNINNTTFENTVAHGGNSGNGGNSSGPAGGADGGGLYSLGNVTVSNSTFHLAGATGGNAGNAFGDGCFGAHNAGDGGAARGGAVFADGGTMTIDTATFAGNFAVGGNGGNGGQTDGGCGSHGAGGPAYGGAVSNNAGTVNIQHSTISLNNTQGGNTGVNQFGANQPARLVAEGAGGGVRVGAAGVTFANTIVSDNTAANGVGDNTGAPTPGPNVDGAVTSNGHNLLGDATDATGFIGTGDLTGANPMLVPLADNGGPTQTMALSPGSPAVDAGVAAGAAFDQRGMPRTADDPGTANAATSDGTDIGAYEIPVSCSSITCPADISMSNDPGQCGAVVNYTAPSDSGCGEITCDHPSGSFFPVGTTNVTCTSSAGPACSFNVTVNDTEDPTISAPPDASYQCPFDFPAANPSQAVASDNCGTLTVTVSESNNGGAGTAASPFVITRTYTATDGANRTASATQTITVADTHPPTITAPPNASYQCASDVPGASPSQATVSDNCGRTAVMVSESTNGGAGSPASPLVITRTYTARDSAGQTASATQTITVVDNTPPAIACPANIDVSARSCSGAAVEFTVAASDNCGVATVVTSKASGSVFPVGATTVVATATDAVGNSSSCSFTVTVEDGSGGGPVIVTNDQTISLRPPDHKYVTVRVTDLVASASDACDPGVTLQSVVISQVTSDESDNSLTAGLKTNDIVIDPDCRSVKLRRERLDGGNGRVYTITFRVTDRAGNVATATGRVTVPYSKLPAVDDGPQHTVVGNCP